MRNITVTLYHYAELSPEAQEHARDRYREASAGDNYFAEHITDEFVADVATLGFDIVTRRGTRTERAIYWDTNPIGAAFDAT